MVRRIPRYRKRHYCQRIDKMESMELSRLERFKTMYYTKGLIVSDLIVLLRLGVTT